MRLVFMGTPEIALPSLEKIFHSSHTIEAVFTQPDRASGRGCRITPPPVKTWAIEKAIGVFQPESLRHDEHPESIIKDIYPDCIVAVAYGLILPKRILDIPRLGCVNLHFSLLPRYRGAAPVNWAIVRGERKTGITTFLMNERMDEGEILLQEEVEILEEERADSLSKRLAEVGSRILLRTLDQWERGEIRPVAQDHSKATYAPIIKKEDGKINWSSSAVDIANMVRGFHPWPGAYSTINSRRVKITDAGPAPDVFQIESISSNVIFMGARSGTVISSHGGAINVLCGDNTILAIRNLQPEGKSEITAREALNGRYLKVGDRFVS
ncbi:MAG: methionyl-tRNA formyltransferase [Acidobacteriota bacterium]